MKQQILDQHNSLNEKQKRIEKLLKDINKMDMEYRTMINNSELKIA